MFWMFGALSSFRGVTTVLRMNRLGITPAVSSSMKQERETGVVGCGRGKSFPSTA